MVASRCIVRVRANEEWLRVRLSERGDYGKGRKREFASLVMVSPSCMIK
jgi:hypothetical protein